MCIAALYEEGSGVVLASDKMVTARFPIGYEFEREAPKIVPMNTLSSIFALTAGDVLLANEILNLARTQVQDTTGATETAEIVRSAYQAVRLANIVRTELEPRGLSLSDYYSNQQSLLPAITQAIDQALAQSDIGVEIIIAGSDESLHSIHMIINPGVTRDVSPIGHSAIGTGAPHAIYSLIGSRYQPSLDRDTVFGLVKTAKEMSEVAPGVGKATEIFALPLRNE